MFVSVKETHIWKCTCFRTGDLNNDACLQNCSVGAWISSKSRIPSGNRNYQLFLSDEDECVYC